MRRAPTTGPNGPFTFFTFEAIGLSRASIDRDAAFFMQVDTVAGADRLAALLNAAVALADEPALLVEAGPPEFAATKVAYAVAKALGRNLDWHEATEVAIRKRGSAKALS